MLNPDPGNCVYVMENNDVTQIESAHLTRLERHNVDVQAIPHHHSKTLLLRVN